MKINSSNSILMGGRISLPPTDIIYLEGDVNYTRLFLTSGECLLVATTLKKLEARLKTHLFFRSHKKYLVNINYVAGCTDNLVSMTNENKVLVSRRRKEHLMELIQAD